jgi:hypothetical protein
MPIALAGDQPVAPDMERPVKLLGVVFVVPC